MKQQIHIKLDQDQKEELEKYAAKKGVSVSYAIRKAIGLLLKDYEFETMESRIRRAVTAAKEGGDF